MSILNYFIDKVTTENRVGGKSDKLKKLGPNYP
jgi:hypothetical protein